MSPNSEQQYKDFFLVMMVGTPGHSVSISNLQFTRKYHAKIVMVDFIG